MNFVFNLDGVICTPPKGIQFGIVEYVNSSKPIVNAIEFIQWLQKDHRIVIWTNRPNDLSVKLATEQWLKLHQVAYDRLIFDRPDDAIYVNETPSNAKYFSYDEDVKIVGTLFEEWKQEWRNDRQHKQRSGDTR
jgi:histidinol phosphatase-like enzyme